MVSIRPMLRTDHALVLQLWQATEGIGLSQSDTASQIAAFLERNPGFSAVAVSEHAGLVGAVLCGHDGRRGYLHHLAVAKAHRKQFQEPESAHRACCPDSS